MISIYSLPNLATAACPECGGAVLGKETSTYRPAANGTQIVGERQPANSQMGSDVRYECLSCHAIWSAEGFQDAWRAADRPTT